MGVHPPDSVAVLRYDDVGSYCFKYDTEEVSRSLKVNPHIWKILKDVDGEYLDVSSSRLISCMQKIRAYFKRRPECLESCGIILENSAGNQIIFENGVYRFLFSVDKVSESEELSESGSSSEINEESSEIG